MLNDQNVFLVLPLKESYSRNSLYSDFYFQEPYTLECLESILLKNGYKTRIFSGNIQKKPLLESIKRHKPFAVCFSIHTYIYEKCLRLAREIKSYSQKNALDLKIIFGGYHPTALPEEVIKENCVDFVIIGEGEVTLIDLLFTIQQNQSYQKIDGIAYKHKNQIHLTKKRARIANLDDLPLPTRDKKYLDKSKYPQIVYPPPSEQISTARISLSRGCCYACTFCPSPSIWDKKVFYRSPKLVVDEIQSLHENFGTNLIGFTDLTFNVNRKIVYDFCQELYERELPVYWWALARADLLDEELLKIMADSKCIKLNIGIESPYQKISESIKGDYHLQENKLFSTFRAMNQRGMIIKAMIIIGLESDSAESIRGYKQQLKKLPIDELHISLATPMPGSELWNKFQKDHTEQMSWGKFTFQNYLPINPNFTEKKLKELRKELYTDFYLSKEYLKHLKEKLKNFPHLKKSWIEYFEFIKKTGIIKNFNETFSLLLNAISKY